MNRVDLIQFENEIDKHIDIFLKHISSVCREGFEYDLPRHNEDSSGFPIFELADKLYYKNKNQEGFLEWQVRDELVNASLDYLFRSHDFDIRWRLGKSYQTTLGFRNKEYETKFPAEFFVVKDKRVTAFKYTLFESDYSIPLNLPQMKYDILKCINGIDHIDRWVSIDWSDVSKKETKNHQKYNKILENSEPFQIMITIEDLFSEFFSVEEYLLFIDKVKEAVAKANEMLGFQTIPRLVSSRLGVFKENVLKEILNMNFREMQYQAVDENGEQITTGYANALVEPDAQIVYDHFYGQSRYLALLGTCKFAKSFITSEYLYSVFKTGMALDYTAIVCGYIKSVEQLCETIVFEILPKQNVPKLYIKAKNLTPDEIDALKKRHTLKKGANNKYLVLLNEDNKEYFDRNLTLGQFFHFFEEHHSILFYVSSNGGFPIIDFCLQNYSKFDRNGYFHKHNINDFAIAKRIRNNTLLVLYWLLGATKFEIDSNSLYSTLGIVDDSFDRLFKKIAFKRCFRYQITFNGKEIKAVRLPSEGGFHFDDQGYIQDATLCFIEVDKYPEDFPSYYALIKSANPSEGIIRIDRTNIPEKMISIDSDGVETIIEY